MSTFIERCTLIFAFYSKHCCASNPGKTILKFRKSSIEQRIQEAYLELNQPSMMELFSEYGYWLKAPLDTANYILIFNPKTAGGSQFDPPPFLWFFEKCFFYREAETLVFCDFLCYLKTHLS